MLFRWRTKTSLECNVLGVFFVFSFVREYLMRHHVIVSFCVAMLQRVVFAKKSCNPTARLQWCPLQSMCAKGLHDSGFNQNFMLGSTIFTNDPIVNHIFIMGFLPPDRTCELTGEQKVFAATHLCISRWRVCVTFFVVVFIQKNAAKFFVRLTFAGFVRSLWFPFFFPRKPWRGPTASRPLPRGALQLSRLGLRLFGHQRRRCQGTHDRVREHES